MDTRLTQQLAFLIEIDKIKGIIRKTRNFSNDRHENDAEHSWHIAVMALVLSEYAEERVDVGRVVRMLLIHDLVEIDAGDVIVYDRSAENEAAEREAADRIFGMLPGDQRDEYRGLWEEFEERSTPEARFAAAVDRLEPVLQNIARRCESWNANGITAEQVFAVTSTIGSGSPALWEYVKAELERLQEEGAFEQ